MRVRVTVMRTLCQYADVIVPNVDTIQAAVDHVADRLNNPLNRARLLHGVTWVDIAADDFSLVDGSEAIEE
jgi:hypothetical protein